MSPNSALHAAAGCQRIRVVHPRNTNDREPNPSHPCAVPRVPLGCYISPLLLGSSNDFGMIGVRSPFFYFCNRPQIRIPTHTPNPRALAGGTLAVKNQRRAPAISLALSLSLSRWRADTLESYYVISAGSSKIPLRGDNPMNRNSF